MKVLFITSSYPAHQDDPRGIFIHRLARGLCREGIHVTVITPSVPDAPVSTMLDGVEVQRLPYWINRWQYLATGLEGIVPNLRQRPWLVLQVPALIATLSWRALCLASDFDVVHAHWLYPAGVAGVLAARRGKVPLVVTSQGGDLNLTRSSRGLRLLSRSISRAADVCVGVSDALCEQFIALGVPSAKVRCISSAGIDPEDGLSPVAGDIDASFDTFTTCEAFRLLYVGSLTPRKSVVTLLEAHRELERRGHYVACAIIGPGPTKDALQRMVQEHALRNVFFVGVQSPAVVPRWMAAAQVCVLPSLSEGRPNVVLEALALGLPVVATDIPGTRELIRDGQTGFLFPPRDATRLADCLERLIVDGHLLQEMGHRGQEYIETQGLTATHAVRQYMALYEQIGAKQKGIPGEEAV